MATETKWTPGPWYVHTHIERYGPDESFYWAISAEPDEDQPFDYIAACDGAVGLDIDGALANAHLIAAAPELYEALEDMLNMYAPAYHDCTDNGLPECELCVAKDALSKARGES